MGGALYSAPGYRWSGLRLTMTMLLVGQQFLEYFFGEDDAKFFAKLGLNCIRLPVSHSLLSHSFPDA